MYRPEIKVLDCSIRDGGLINKWQFTDELVRSTYGALAEAGVDYMESGVFVKRKILKRSWGTRIPKV